MISRALFAPCSEGEINNIWFIVQCFTLLYRDSSVFDPIAYCNIGRNKHISKYIEEEMSLSASPFYYPDIIVIPYFFKEKQHHIDKKCRNQNSTGPSHIAEETRHFNIVFFYNRFNHKIRCISNISIAPHKNGASRNDFQHDLRNCPNGCGNSLHCAECTGRLQKHQICRRIIQER